MKKHAAPDTEGTGLNSALPDARQKFILGFSFLALVAIGSVLVWRGFGEGSPSVSLRGHERGSHSEGRRPEESRDPSPPLAAQDDAKRQIASTSSGAPSRNDGEDTALAIYGQAPDFTLTERSGQAFSKSELGGKPWIADFIFTSCPGQCPMMSSEMSRIQRLFPKETEMQFASFTVDPKRDTPEILAEYAERYGAEKGRWFFLTGPNPEIDRILKGFFLSPVEEPAMHSLYFILVDREGKIRGYYDSSDAGAIERLIRDGKALVTSS